MWGPADDAEAKDRLAALLTLDRNPHVAQLRAAKVPQHTIDALYPHEFEDLVPGLIEYFGAYDLDAFDGSGEDDWQNHAGSTSALLRDVSVNLKAQSQSEFDQFRQTQAEDALHEHLTSGISGQAIEIRARFMIEALFYAHWFMLRADESGSRVRIATYFLEITDWLLPDLWDRFTNQLEAGR